MTETVSDPRTVRTEKIVLTVGFLLTYGLSAVFSFFFSVLAVGGGGEAIGAYVIAAAFLGAMIGCFVLSVRLAARRMHVRAILLGFVPVPLVVTGVYLVTTLANAFR